VNTSNISTNSTTAQSYSAASLSTGTSQQTNGQALFQQASQSNQPDTVVKRQFEQRTQGQKTNLANQFIDAAGRDGVNQIAATPDGQHALAEVYEHANSDGRALMRQVHEEQGNTAVDYTGKQASSNSSNYADDPLNVSDAGVEIGPRISVTDYAAMTSGIVYGLVENTVKGIAHMGAVVGKESQELKNVDNLEYAGIDEYGQESDSPGLTIPSMEEVGNALKGHIEATNQALRSAKDKGDYFGAGKAISNDPMLQMTGLGEMAIFGSLAKMRIVTKLDSFAKNDGKLSGGNGNVGPVVEGKAGRPESAEQVSGIDMTNGPTKQSEVDAPYSTLIKGAAFRHRTMWTQNLAGARSVDDALKLADDYGVYIADDVKINFVDDAFYDRTFGKYGDSYASYGHVEAANLDQQLTWKSALIDRDGNVNIYIRNSVLDSDEAIIAVLHHETHEIEALRDVFAKRVSLSAREYGRLVNDSTPGNLHWEGVDVGDQAVWQLRQDRGY
jgi:hypothetical protein